MLWLSISSGSPELRSIATNTHPLTIFKKFWQFSQRYGEYQSRPVSDRRQFILDLEHSDAQKEPCL